MVVKAFYWEVFQRAHNFHMRIYVNLVIEEFEEAGLTDLCPSATVFLPYVVLG